MTIKYLPFLGLRQIGTKKEFRLHLYLEHFTPLIEGQFKILVFIKTILLLCIFKDTTVHKKEVTIFIFKD